MCIRDRILFAALEAFIGFCAGCKVFKLLMNIGLIPNDVCEKCSNYQFEIKIYG